MQTDDPYEIKRLSYKIQGFDKERWRHEGFDICFRGVEAKFKQNPPLLAMLKTTYPKILVEATSDRLWSTGVPMHDSNVLKSEKWLAMVGYQKCWKTLRNPHKVKN